MVFFEVGNGDLFTTVAATKVIERVGVGGCGNLNFDWKRRLSSRAGDSEHYHRLTVPPLITGGEQNEAIVKRERHTGSDVIIST